ncbi:MAG: hypothetical protein ACI4L8_02155 [Candidatus Fimadaptatus sp.]
MRYGNTARTVPGNVGALVRTRFIKLRLAGGNAICDTATRRGRFRAEKARVPMSMRTRCAVGNAVCDAETRRSLFLDEKARWRMQMNMRTRRAVGNAICDTAT